MLISRLPDVYRTSTILAPSRIQSQEEEAQYVGIYSVLVSVITLSGGELSDAKLQRHLTRLNAKDNMPMEKTETMLNRMIKQGYLAKVKSKGAAGEDDNVTWFVGPRGKMELGSEAIAGLVRSVYGAPSEDLEKRLQASLKIEPRSVNRTQANGQAVNNSSEEDEEDEDNEEAQRGHGLASVPKRSGRRQAAQESGESEDEEEDD
jgi:melanoma-associated antigen